MRRHCIAAVDPSAPIKEPNHQRRHREGPKMRKEDEDEEEEEEVVQQLVHLAVAGPSFAVAVACNGRLGRDRLATRLRH